MNFLQAVKAMKEGKKVWNNKFMNGHYYFIQEDELRFFCEGKSTVEGVTDLDLLEATDWEIIEEKKTLSDKRTYYGVLKEAIYEEKDVKETLKEFLNDIEMYLQDNIEYNELKFKARKRFGGRLLSNNQPNH